MQVFKITPTVQQYDWGKLGPSSKVAVFAQSAGLSDFRVDETKPYAEVCVYVMPKSPSLISGSGETLASYLSKNPFLFKVLAIEKALSIQSHPDKETARKLHAQQPNIYKDPNHKPEMALAITPFAALCGFLPPTRIAAYLRVPELAALIPQDIRDDFFGHRTYGGAQRSRIEAVAACCVLCGHERSSEHLHDSALQADKALRGWPYVSRGRR